LVHQQSPYLCSGSQECLGNPDNSLGFIESEADGIEQHRASIEGLWIGVDPWTDLLHKVASLAGCTIVIVKQQKRTWLGANFLAAPICPPESVIESGSGCRHANPCAAKFGVIGLPAQIHH
jgi:hypothetical protein